MQIVHHAVHTFTGRPDLIEKAYSRNFSYREKHKYERDVITNDTVIVYPHAVSCFIQSSNITREYAAESFSKSFKHPVLVCTVGVQSVTFDSKVFVMHWGIGGKCICHGQTVSVYKRIERDEAPDFHKVCEQSNVLPSGSSQWSNLWNTLTPLQFAQKMQEELGVFLGGPGFEDFLQEECTLKKKYLFGTIYHQQ